MRGAGRPFKKAMHEFVSDRICPKDLTHSTRAGLHVTLAIAAWLTPPRLVNR